MSGEARGLTPLQDLRARLKPGALCFALATPPEAAGLRRGLPREGLAWVGWEQREALLRAWRPAAQERYHSVAGRDAPSLRAWLAERFKEWRGSAALGYRPQVHEARLERALDLAGLQALAARPLSLLSNGEAGRACLAAALGGEPSLLVLDDLCEGLDAKGRDTLLSCAGSVAAGGAAVLVLASRESLLPWAGPRQAAAFRTDAGVRTATGARTAAVSSPAEVFRCRGVRLEAGDRVLVQGLDWTLRQGEAWWLQGPNGAGKSTLLAYLSGEHPQAWAQSWALLGKGRQEWTPLDALRGRVAWVSPELAALAARPLERLLAEALEKPADLLILYEALRGLGAAALERSQKSLQRSMRERPGRSTVFVSHDPLELPGCISHSLHLDGEGAWFLDAHGSLL